MPSAFRSRDDLALVRSDQRLVVDAPDDLRLLRHDHQAAAFLVGDRLAPVAVRAVPAAWEVALGGAGRGGTGDALARSLALALRYGDSIV